MNARAGSRLGILILAAGKGTRLKTSLPKVLHQVGGKPLLQHVIEAARSVAATDDIYVVVGHSAEQVRRATAASGVQFVEQREQRGTGHAVICARTVLERYSHFLVLSGDVPMIRPESIAALRDYHLAQKAAMTILTATPTDPTGYGRIVRSGRGPAVSAIVEQRSATAKQRKIREINSGIYVFSTRELVAAIGKLGTDNPHGEYYLTDVAGVLVKARKKVVALPVAEPAEVLGANTLAELAELDATLRQRKCQELMQQGVVLYRPETCIVDAGVTVGADTVIEPFVQLLGETRIGGGCRIRSYSILEDVVLGERVLVRPGCVVTQSRVGNDAVLGPYTHVRPGCEIGEGAHLGNFVETKKTKLGKGAKASHLTYLGDAELGDQVNVGAGTITCNYDGAHKHLTVIEEEAFIGSDSTLVAPVRIGKGAYIGAGSCITEDVPPGALAVARGRQENKPGWAERRRARKGTG